MIPKGLIRCEVCGEYKGDCLDHELPGGEGELVPISVRCLCEGLVCGDCGHGRVHRPISNYYNESRGEIIHVPYFMAGRKCASCGGSTWVELGAGTAEMA